MRAPKATCGWCNEHLVTATVSQLEGVWVCLTAECRQRQLDHALIVTPRGQKSKCLNVPLPSQVPLYETSARNVLWGGQAGPGKSHGVRWWLYGRSLRTPEHEALLLRENWEQLDKTHLRKMEREVPLLGGKFFKSDRKAVFGTGSNESIIDCGHMAETDAVTRYLSTEYGAIVPDEASLYPVDAEGSTPLAELSTRARKVYKDTAGKEVRPKFVPVTNPGGPSARWLRDMFIDHEPDFEKYPQLAKVYDPAQWLYIPAKLDDNPYQDPEYEVTLANVSKVRFEQLRHGDWSVFSGQFFSDWVPHVHVAEAVPA
jgi:phage terminase large subunit